MRVRRFDEVTAFAEVAEPFLVAREAEHNLLLGILTALRDPRGAYADVDPYLAVGEVSGEVAAVALRTPPQNLVVSCVDDPAAPAALADDLAGTGEDPSGITAPPEITRAFSERWEELTGSRSEVAMRMRVHMTADARMPYEVPGGLRDPTDEDRDLLADWGMAFQGEALHEKIARERAEEWVHGMLASTTSGLVVWDRDGEVVSMAGYGGLTPNGIRVFAVYTPPERRGKGYATGCVGRLTERLLAGGRRFCYLFTDLANPTSNALYRRIGYKPVIDVDERRFSS